MGMRDRCAGASVQFWHDERIVGRMATEGGSFLVGLTCCASGLGYYCVYLKRRRHQSRKGSVKH